MPQTNIQHIRELRTVQLTKFSVHECGGTELVTMTKQLTPTTKGQYWKIIREQ
jgi:hypothetical protein